MKILKVNYLLNLSQRNQVKVAKNGVRVGLMAMLRTGAIPVPVLKFQELLLLISVNSRHPKGWTAS